MPVCAFGVTLRLAPRASRGGPYHIRGLERLSVGVLITVGGGGQVLDLLLG